MDYAKPLLAINWTQFNTYHNYGCMIMCFGLFFIISCQEIYLLIASFNKRE